MAVARGRAAAFCSLCSRPCSPGKCRGNTGKIPGNGSGGEDQRGWRKSDAKTFHGPFTSDQLRRGNCHPLNSPHTLPISLLVFSRPFLPFTRSNGLIVDRWLPDHMKQTCFSGDARVASSQSRLIVGEGGAEVQGDFKADSERVSRRLATFWGWKRGERRASVGIGWKVLETGRFRVSGSRLEWKLDLPVGGGSTSVWSKESNVITASQGMDAEDRIVESVTAKGFPPSVVSFRLPRIEKSRKNSH